MGALWVVSPVVFNTKSFTLYGVLNVISNIKGKGYGKQVMMAMRAYLAKHNYVGLGFCMVKNKGFYEKCGYAINTTATKRFVYTKGTEKITNQDGQIIFYQDTTDKIMQTVFNNPQQEVSIPTAELW